MAVTEVAVICTNCRSPYFTSPRSAQRIEKEKPQNRCPSCRMNNVSDVTLSERRWAFGVWSQIDEEERWLISFGLYREDAPPLTDDALEDWFLVMGNANGEAAAA